MIRFPDLARVAVRDLTPLELFAAILRADLRTDDLPVSLRAIVREEAIVTLALDPVLGDLTARNAFRLRAAVELGRRVACELATSTAPPLPDPAAVATWGMRLHALDHEELWLLALDGRNGLRAARCVAAGGLHGLQIALADPLRTALRAGASAFVLVHNHPSGDPTPSEEDTSFTDRVAEASDLLGVPLVDHVVVARGGHVSMLERGLVRARASP